MAITGIRVENKEEMKVPNNELVFRLCIGASPDGKDQPPLAGLLMHNTANALWQASGLEIDEFYRQFMTGTARGWIMRPKAACVTKVAAS